mmetsp:Transcript_30497/g.68391  ORF Transcript_30497/g.68391 Transcript_30497/m.68391 type:complete len:217 (-) Transcript_30497:15-665(-)
MRLPPHPKLKSRLKVRYWPSRPHDPFALSPHSSSKSSTKRIQVSVIFFESSHWMAIFHSVLMKSSLDHPDRALGSSGASPTSDASDSSPATSAACWAARSAALAWASSVHQSGASSVAAASVSAALVAAASASSSVAAERSRCDPGPASRFRGRRAGHEWGETKGFANDGVTNPVASGPKPVATQRNSATAKVISGPALLIILLNSLLCPRLISPH